MVKIQANTNFHTVTEKTVFDIFKDSRFLEYRRRWHEYPTSFRVGSYPLHLDIESTNICNLRCPFCATTSHRWGSAKGGFMSMELFRRIIDKSAANGLHSVKLSLRGEPLLHPQISEMVDYARRSGIMDIYFNTNAMLLDEKLINKLLDAGLVRISISIEGTTKKIYESCRVGARFEDVLHNVKRLKELRDERNLSIPQIRVQTVLLEELKKNFPSYVRFWKEIADEVSYLDARKEKANDANEERVADWACPFLWQRMAILWDGTILPCLAHGISDFSQITLGNIKELTIRDAWKSQLVSNMRRVHKSGKSHKISTCLECSYRAMETEKLICERR